MISPVTLGGHPELKIMGLAPMAIAPDRQRQGIGSALGAVVVLGHPEYYPRFGFSPAVRFGVTSEYEVPDEVFMVVELRPGFLHGVSGQIKYHSAFGDL